MQPLNPNHLELISESINEIIKKERGNNRIEGNVAGDLEKKLRRGLFDLLKKAEEKLKYPTKEFTYDILCEGQKIPKYKSFEKIAPSDSNSCKTDDFSLNNIGKLYNIFTKYKYKDKPLFTVFVDGPQLVIETIDNNKSTIVVQIDLQEELLITQPGKAKDQLWLVGYYWRYDDKIGLATINLTSDLKSGSARFHYSQREIMLRVHAIYENSGLLTLRLEDELPNDGLPVIYSQMNVYLPNKGEGNRLFTGVYATNHRNGHEPTCGLILLERMNSLAEIDNFVKARQEDSTFAIEIVDFLRNARIGLPAKNIKKGGASNSYKYIGNYLHKLPDIEYTYKGLYQGYFIDPADFHENQLVITGYRYEIDDELNRIIYTPPYNKDSQIVGYFVNKHPSNVIAYLGERAGFKHPWYRLIHIFQYDEEKKIAYGIYSGIYRRPNNPRPIAGRFFLKKVTADTPISFEKTPISDFSDKLIIDYLLGQSKEDSRHLFTDSFVAFQLSQHLIKQGLRKEEYFTNFPFSGQYELIVNERYKESVIKKYDIEIQVDGLVFLAQEGVKQCEGYAEQFGNKYLRIQIEPYSNNEGFWGTIIFSTHSKEASVKTYADVKYLYGIMVRMDNTRIESMALVLTKPKPNTPWNLLDHQQLKRTTEIKSDEKEWNYDEFDSVYEGALSFLGGQTYRLMRLPRTPNRSFRPRKKEYRRVSFYTACELSRRSRLDNDYSEATINEIEENLREAHRHGFAAEYFKGVKILDLLAELEQTEESSDTKQLIDDLKSLLKDQEMLLESLQNETLLKGERFEKLIRKRWKWLP